jgi:hypothetical protein
MFLLNFTSLMAEGEALFVSQKMNRVGGIDFFLMLLKTGRGNFYAMLL